jgi:hypothetical protein
MEWRDSKVEIHISWFERDLYNSRPSSDTLGYQPGPWIQSESLADTMYEAAIVPVNLYSFVAFLITARKSLETQGSR